MSYADCLPANRAGQDALGTLPVAAPAQAYSSLQDDEGGCSGEQEDIFELQKKTYAKNPREEVNAPKDVKTAVEGVVGPDGLESEDQISKYLSLSSLRIKTQSTKVYLASLGIKM